MSTEPTAQRITRAWMAHLGYEPEEIAEAEVDEPHAQCDWQGEFWMCHDEDGKSLHPAFDELDNTAALVMFTLKHADQAAAEARGHAKAVAQLRDGKAYDRWANQHRPTGPFLMPDERALAADYLEAQGATP